MEIANPEKSKIQNAQTSVEDPVVSVIIITYNSANFVIDTLESIKAQSYQKLELFISDDGSSDSTVELCKSWLKKNSQRFLRSKVIEVEKNTGIPANCNRGLKEVQGEWVKLLAGDDILVENAISMLLKESVKYPDDQFFFTQGLGFEEKNGEMVTYDHLLPEILTEKVMKNELDLVGQHKLLLLRQYIFAPSCFLKKSLIDLVEGFDEKYPLLDDYPFY
ncbi:MAG: glycosyltransferase, partial [Bacteroidota bacterium]